MKDLGIFPLFHGFNLQIIKTIKLTAISWRAANTISCYPQACCSSVVNKKNIFQGLMTKYLQNFEFTFQNGSNFRKTLTNYLLTSAERFKIFTFFFMDLLTNYVGVIVPSFNLSSIVLWWNEIMHQKFMHFSTFSWF